MGFSAKGTRSRVVEALSGHLGLIVVAGGQGHSLARLSMQMVLVCAGKAEGPLKKMRHGWPTATVAPMFSRHPKLLPSNENLGVLVALQPPKDHSETALINVDADSRFSLKLAYDLLIF